MLRRNQSGYTLAELLIAVVIILLIGAIVYPTILRSQLAADESATISFIRTLNKAQSAYQSTYPTLGFAANLSALGPNNGRKCDIKNAGPAGACLIGGELVNAVTPATASNGYWFHLTPTSKDRAGATTGYVIGAAPAVFNKTGVRDFCSSEEAIIHFQVPNGNSEPVTSAAACAAMPVLQ